MATPDRIGALHETDAVVGMDFVYVFPDQVTLSVYFHPALSQNAEQILGAVQPSQIRIYSPSGGESLPVVPVQTAAWATQEGRRVLALTTTEPGDFSRYRLHIDDTTGRLDPYFNDLPFTFKANCPSDFDCATPPHECPPDTPVDYPVSYLARDFFSFRQALIDFASARYPAWQDRLIPDQGMMLLEAMSALGDEFAYYQDRIARESYLETATQRRSLRRHARLVDYNLNDGLGATSWLDFTVTADGALAAGTPVWETLLRGSEPDPAKRLAASRAVFEIGLGLNDPGNPYKVLLGANQFLPYSWDENQTCLPVGSTALHIAGHHAADLPLDDFSNPNLPGKWVVLRTSPADASIPSRTWMAFLTGVSEQTDPLFGQAITYLEWEDAQATPFEMQYESLVIRGNIVPATAGQTLVDWFQIEPQNPPGLPGVDVAIERQGPLLNNPPSQVAEDGEPPSELSPALLRSLPGSDQRDLVWLGASPDVAAPEVRLYEQLTSKPPTYSEWEWKRSFLGVNSSQSSDTHFMLDDGSWRRIAGYRRVDEASVVQEYLHQDYASGLGTTIRFGDGEFGQPPARGAVFRAVYRLGNGRRDNVAAGSLTDFDPATLAFVSAVTNPFDVTNAVAAETSDQVRQLAPEAYQVETFRAVRPEDYVAAVERLDWVQNAGAQPRWTGSWITMFATPDPRGSFELTASERDDLGAQLDRYRLAGREAFGSDPYFVTIDLRINVCVEPAAYSGDVEFAVLEALFGRRGLRPRPGFFSPDNFTFGTPLDRAGLEAAIQDVPGVRAVEDICIRRRGWFDWRVFTESAYPVGNNEIIRIENNRELPERGAVRILTHGGV